MGGDGHPDIYFNSIGIMAGKYFYFSQYIRLHSSLGLAGNFIETPENYYLITKSCRGMGLCLFSGTCHE